MPYVCGTLSLHPRSFWSVAPAYYLGQLQKEQYDISLQAAKRRRIAILKFLFRGDAISKEELSRLLSADVGASAKVSTQFPMSEIIAPLNTTNNYDYMLEAENNRRDARSVSGMSRNQMGEYDKSTRRTASEAKLVAMGSGRRTGKRSQVIQGIYIDLIDKINSLVFDFWRVPREMMVGVGQFDMVTGDMLKGDYQYGVSLSTKRSISRAERKVEALMLMAQIAPFVPPQGIAALYQYLIDAAGDPAFEAILMSGARGGLGGQGGSQQGRLPAGQGTQ